eukprot:SAG31_NODE_2561_length_5481_cov_2.689335_7_plen_205_part_00
MNVGGYSDYGQYRGWPPRVPQIKNLRPEHGARRGAAVDQISSEHRPPCTYVRPNTQHCCRALRAFLFLVRSTYAVHGELRVSLAVVSLLLLHSLAVSLLLLHSLAVVSLLLFRILLMDFRSLAPRAASSPARPRRQPPDAGPRAWCARRRAAQDGTDPHRQRRLRLRVPAAAPPGPPPSAPHATRGSRVRGHGSAVNRDDAPRT